MQQSNEVPEQSQRCPLFGVTGAAVIITVLEGEVFQGLSRSMHDRQPCQIL